MALQWRMESTHAWYGFSGKFVAASVVAISYGVDAGKWKWFTEFPAAYNHAREGRCISLALARRAANKAWRRFLLRAALKAE